MTNKSKTKDLGYWGMVIISFGLFITISILSYQFYHWTTKGEWLPLPLYKPLQYVGVSFVELLDLEWQGLQKFIFWLLEQPLAGVIGVFSLATGWLMSMRD